MKPKNFPGRKNQRRKVALGKKRVAISGTNSQDEEIAILESRIIDPEQARAIRTKKRRALKA